MSASRRVLVGNLSYPESPRWHDGRLWFSDMYASEVFCLADDGRIEVVARVENQPSGLGFGFDLHAGGDPRAAALAMIAADGADAGNRPGPVWHSLVGGIDRPYGFNKGAFTLIIALTLFFGISFLSKQQKIDPHIARVMDL